MTQQVPVQPDAELVVDNDAGLNEIATDLAYRLLGIVNVVFIGAPRPDSGQWILVDAGLAGTTRAIIRAAENRFGKGARPCAIMLTHGHFDHVGALTELAQEWNVPIYAHLAETPYLDGSESYPAPDPSAGGVLCRRCRDSFRADRLMYRNG